MKNVNFVVKSKEVSGFGKTKIFCDFLKFFCLLCIFSSSNAISAVQGEWGEVSTAKIRITVVIVDNNHLKPKEVFEHGICTKSLGESKVIRESLSLDRVKDCLASVGELEVDDRDSDLIRLMPM